MERNRYTLRELSEDLDISIRDLRMFIKQGTLQVKKEGNAYWVAESELETFLKGQLPLRNYLCENYSRCLNTAAVKNRTLNCEACSRFVEADTFHAGDAYPLWDNGISSSMTMH